MPTCREARRQAQPKAASFESNSVRLAAKKAIALDSRWPHPSHWEGVMLRRLSIIMILSVAGLAGCVVHEPVPTTSPAKFDRSWNAALGAVQDAGVQITSADPSTGVIRGTRRWNRREYDRRTSGRWQRARSIRHHRADQRIRVFPIASRKRTNGAWAAEALPLRRCVDLAGCPFVKKREDKLGRNR